MIEGRRKIKKEKRKKTCRTFQSASRTSTPSVGEDMIEGKKRKKKKNLQNFPVCIQDGYPERGGGYDCLRHAHLLAARVL